LSAFDPTKVSARAEAVKDTHTTETIPKINKTEKLIRRFMTDPPFPVTPWNNGTLFQDELTDDYQFQAYPQN
jgi:hypothetical protein